MFSSADHLLLLVWCRSSRVELVLGSGKGKEGRGLVGEVCGVGTRGSHHTDGMDALTTNLFAKATLRDCRQVIMLLLSFSMMKPRESNGDRLCSGSKFRVNGRPDREARSCPTLFPFPRTVVNGHKLDVASIVTCGCVSVLELRHQIGSRKKMMAQLYSISDLKLEPKMDEWRFLTLDLE